MAAVDTYVQVAPDSIGKKIDNAELTRDSGVSVLRQRIVIASDAVPPVQAGVGGESGKGYLFVESKDMDEVIEKLGEIVMLLRMLVE